MNDKITLLYNVQNKVTVLPNKFIDEYMIKADGEYVKTVSYTHLVLAASA